MKSHLFYFARNGQEQALPGLSQEKPSESLEEVKAPFMKTRELAPLSVFSAIWIASLTTRIIHFSPLTGLVTGAGYDLGGLAFDALYFGRYGWKPSRRSDSTFLLVVSIISGTLAMVFYIILKFSMLNIEVLIALIPL